MKKNNSKDVKDNKIVKFIPREEEEKIREENGEILNMQGTWVLRNARLFSLNKRDSKLADILIEGEKITKIERHIDDIPPRCQEADLDGDYVLPLFVNGFFDPIGAVRDTYDVDVELEDTELLFLVKTTSSGGYAFLNEFDNNYVLLDGILDKTDEELSEICDFVAKGDLPIYIRAGLDLEEMGSVDKRFQKPLSQVLEDFGFLDRKCVIVGGNCFDKDDWTLFAQYGVSVVICPLEDSMIGRRALNLCMLKDLGINIMLGSGHSANVDLFENMRMLIASQRSMFEDKDVIDEKDALYYAFGGDRDVLSKLTKINVRNFIELKRGSQANFMIVRNEHNFFGDTAKNLVWEKNKNDVLLTCFNGIIVQVCGISSEFEMMEEQYCVLAGIARLFSRKRKKKQREEGNKED